MMPQISNIINVKNDCQIFSAIFIQQETNHYWYGEQTACSTYHHRLLNLAEVSCIHMHARMSPWVAVSIYFIFIISNNVNNK